MDEPAKPRPGHLTLLEAALLLVVLGGVVLFVVLPAMREARMRKNEETALDTLHQVNPFFPFSPVQQTSGYKFESEEYWDGIDIHAHPIVPGGTGHRFFLLHLRGKRSGHGLSPWTLVIHFSVDRPATSADSPVE